MSIYCNPYDKNTDCRSILECGRSIFAALPKTEFDALDPTTGDQPILLAEVTIDTRKLLKPCVKTEYSSLINTVLNGSPSSVNPKILILTLRLVRKCKGDNEEALRTWIYERTVDGDTDLTTEDSFTVTFCECFDHTCCNDPAGKCCTYTLQLVQVQGSNSSGVLNAVYSICEREISAIASCSSCIH